MQKWLIGVDEAGRGPLAGPVSVGVVCVPKNFNWSLIEGVNDSKKLTEQKREAIFEITKKLKREGKLDFSVSMVGSKIIDKKGIVPSIKLAMQRALKKVTTNPSPRAALGLGEYEVKLDGALYAPGEYVNQETIIKGDSKEKVIGLASIMAKVTRDRYMVKLSMDKGGGLYSKYEFAIHKGYGTKMHRQNIMRYGLSDVHRKSFCKNVMLLM